MHPGWGLYVVPGLILRAADLFSLMSRRINEDLRDGWAAICLNHNPLAIKGWSTIDGIWKLSKMRKKCNFDILTYGFCTMPQSIANTLYILNHLMNVNFERSIWPSSLMPYYQENISKSSAVVYSSMCLRTCPLWIHVNSSLLDNFIICHLKVKCI